MEKPSTFVELLQTQAREKPQRIVYTFLADGVSETARLTLAELDSNARVIASKLQSLRLEGSGALLLYPPGLEFIKAFFGCLYAGVVAVPVQPPHSNKALPKLSALIRDALPQVVLTSTSLEPRVARWLKALWSDESVPVWATDGLALSLAEQWQEPTVKCDTLALLQYTSGSTAAPKGVMLTHANLLHNERLIQIAFQQNEESIVVGWLPVYHDMGLIGNVLQPLYVGASCVLMPPTAFLQNPLCWLQAISRYRATTSGGPNFAYELCARKISPAAKLDLDLNSWTVAFNGSERVRAETLEAFAKAFSVCGFKRETFYPCYGLAEATLLVSGGRESNLARPSGTADSNSPLESSTPQPYVSCGEVGDGTSVVVVDPKTLKPCASNQVGEIWVSGPGVAAGYWRRPIETDEVFRAYLDEGRDGPFLRTGDLGLLQSGSLFMTGRLKELIIIRGRNYHPQDVESTIEKSHASFRFHRAAAFSVELRGEERLVVVQEIERDHKIDLSVICALARKSVAEEHGLSLDEIVLVRVGTIPRTTSGKIQRHTCRTQYLSDSLRVVARRPVSAIGSEPAGSGFDRDAVLNQTPAVRCAFVEEWLKRSVSEALNLPNPLVSADQPLVSLGLDSLMLTELRNRIEEVLEVTIPFSSLLAGDGISSLSGEILRQLEDSGWRNKKRHPSSKRFGIQTTSHGEKALWFLHRLDPQSSAYNLAVTARICGPLNIAALHKAFQKLVERHESLRTNYVAESGAPVRLIRESQQIPFELVPAENWLESTLLDRLAGEVHRPFEVERDCLIRVKLFSPTAQEHLLALSVHHLVADFRSLEVLAADLQFLYRSYARLNSPDPAELKAQFARYEEFVAWQDELTKGALGAADWDFWEGQLGGELPALKLPAEETQFSNHMSRGAAEHLKLDRVLTERIKALGQDHGATLYVVLLAAFYVLLHRYSRQEDIIVGSPISLRSSPEFTNLVGYLVNQVALRADLSGNPGFVEFLQRVRQRVVAAFEHKDYPFSLLVERLRPTRDATRHPIFQVMFAFQQTSQSEKKDLAAFALGQEGATLRLDDLEIASLETAPPAAQFPLTLMASETEDGIAASLQYDPSSISAATAARMLLHYANLLGSIVDMPECRLQSLTMLSEAERCRQIIEWNQTSRGEQAGMLLHEFFEAQVQRTPSAIAIQFGQDSLDYFELNSRANQLAHYLKAIGLGPENTIGILMKRSPGMLVAMLAALKAGGAYVSLDPAYPSERIGFMIEDARVSVLLTQQDLLDAFPAHQAEVIPLDALWSKVARGSAKNPSPVVTPENLAYLIYTSGSTGQPKGVAIEHRSAASFLRWAGEVFTSDELKGVLASTSTCFDLSIFEFFVPLSHGGTVILVDNALELPAASRANQVTLVNTVPSAIAELLQQDGLPACVQTVNLAGEPLNRALVKQLYATGTVRRVYNLYGPSEDTTYSTWALVAKEDDGPPAIGRPIADTQAYLLDQEMQPVPIGVAGELFLGGAGLARGYLHKPDLTAARFIPNPFGELPGARLYRTGDLARHLPDGNIEFIGRFDQQVKLRGFRIEIGEIENVMRVHHLIKDVAVSLVEDQVGERRLVAYIVFNQQESVRFEELKRYARLKLPDYMIPAVFVSLDALPLTANGKLDRRRLPPPDLAQLSRGSEFAPPRTDVEAIVAHICSDLLGLDQVGIHDNFFELGGHSLLAARLVGRVRKALKVDLPLRKIFETPNVHGLARHIKEKLGRGLADCDPILPVPREGPLPLSFAQERLWFLEQLETTVALYNIPLAVRLSGELNIPDLQRCFERLVRRHEALRTNIRANEGRPVQVISTDKSLSLPLIDLSEAPGAMSASLLQQILINEGRKRFDLARDRLIRVGLIRLGARDHVLFVTIHHIISDEGSLKILLDELAMLYSSPSSTVPELRLQYADYVSWQRQRLRGERLDSQLSYWKSKLNLRASDSQVLTDHPRPVTQSFRGATVTREFSGDLLAALKELSERNNATLFMTLLATFQVLLYRYTGEHDIRVGLPISSRDDGDLESVMGCFLNLLVLQTGISDKWTFEELLSHVREVCLGAFANRDVPFELLVKELQPQRDLSRNPLFQVMFAFQAEPLDVALSGLKIEFLRPDYGVAKCDLTLVVEITSNGFIGSIEYNVDLFKAETITCMLNHYANLLTAIRHHPEGLISSLLLLDERERRTQLVEWNSTRPKEEWGSVIEELEAQVARGPDEVAVVSGEEQLTYREMNERANQLGRYLLRAGVAREERVGILLERSVAMIWAMVGVLKAGAAYVPLEVMNPVARVKEMIADGEIGIVLSTEKWRSTLAEAGVRAICVDGAEGAAVAEEKVEAVGEKLAAENLAYVIYTSGSTGKPKGVMIQHGSLINHSRAFADRCDLRPADRVLQFASLSFDVAAEEIFPSLLNGCRIFIHDGSASGSITSFLNYVSEKRLTVLNLPASFWHEWVSELSSPTVLPPTLRLLIVGSEPVLNERLIRWRQLTGSRVKWLNAYGTSETTITSTICEPAAGRGQGSGSTVSIGKPIGNTRVYLLDRALQLLPAGVAGEICVSGSGLARGYLNAPGQTAEKFVPDPYSGEAGARMYRTGDVGRYLGEGEIEFLGRDDEQVKIRGYRIEPGEVETALVGHEQVRQAVVVMNEGKTGDKRLVAYVVTDGAAVSGMELRSYLQASLPDYLVPSAFIRLETLPLTPHGKVDRRNLARREIAEAPLPVEVQAAPRTLVEELLADIWAEVLGFQRVGVTDSFFALGGHSLLAVRIQARVRQLFQVDLPAAQVFETPTIRGMAQALDAVMHAGPHMLIAPIRCAGRTGPLPLSPSQERLWFLDQLQPGSSAYNIAGATRFTGRLNVLALERALNEIIARHEALRSSFSASNGKPIQIITPELLITMPVVDLSELPEIQVEAEGRRLTTLEAQRVFDLTEAPLLRIMLLRESEESHVFVLTMHHIVSDAWSLANFSRELAVLYEAFNAGRESPLDPLPRSYADYVEWQHESAQGEAVAVHRAYWKRKLSGPRIPLRLPTDYARSGLPAMTGATQLFHLPDGLSESLRALARGEGVTLFMLLLAALQTELSYYSGQEDIAIGTDVAGRDRVDAEGLIGFFINTLVLRTDLAGDPTFRELLGRVRMVTLEALAHQYLPFQELVKELQPARGLGETPLFQVMLVMQNAPDLTFSMPGLSVTTVRVYEQSSAFDLSVSIEEGGDGRLGGSFRYSTELFQRETIARMIEDFVALLGRVVADPDARLSNLRLALKSRLAKHSTERKKQSAKFAGLSSLRPRTVRVKGEELVKLRPISPQSLLPFVIEPVLDDLDLAVWVRQHRDMVEENLHRYGAILFRNFEVDSLSQFENFARAGSNQLMTYGERSSPRTSLGGLVYTSTDHPADQDILLHNEQSYTLEWPMRIWFFCQQPAASAGATPLADSRRIANRLGDTAGDFERRQVMYVRNYGTGLGLPWQEAFQTSDRAAVEEHCRRASIDVEWRDDGRLRTRQVRPAIRKHPLTGETVWFNHALFFHVSSLDLITRESVMNGLPEADWPFNTYYGDGSPIGPKVLEMIREAYRMETARFDWQRGDILMVDNMLVAHGREAFAGERRIAVAMGDPFVEESSASQLSRA